MKAVFCTLAMMFAFSGFGSHATSNDDLFIDFTAFPGSESVYMDISALPNARISKIRFYYSTVSFKDVTENSFYADFDVDEDNSVTDTIIRNLSAGKTYYFKSATIGQDGDILFIMTDDQCDLAKHAVLVL